MGVSSSIGKWLEKAENALILFAAMEVLAITVVTTMDVIGRYFFSFPFPGSYEIMQMLLGGVAFLTFAYVQRTRSNIVIEIILEKLSPKTVAILDLIFLILALPICALMGWEGGKVAIDAFKIGEHTLGVVELPIGPAKMVVPVGFALLCLRLLSQIYGRIVELSKGVKVDQEVS